MAATIDYYFSIVSPWAYIGHDAFHDAVARTGAQVNYKPNALLEVFDRTGTPRLPDRPQSRRDYRMLELQRWREKRGLNFNLQPAHWPFPFATADRMVIAAANAGQNPAAFMGAAFKDIWENEQDLSDAAKLTAIADGAGLSGADLLAASQSDEVGAEYAANTDALVEMGGFGAPFYVLNGEVFWGQDRIDLLEDAIASGRGPYSV